MPPITVYLGAVLVDRVAEARLHSLGWDDVLPIILGMWIATGAQRAIGAYMGYGRNLFVRRVQLEAERRLLRQEHGVRWPQGTQLSRERQRLGIALLGGQ